MWIIWYPCFIGKLRLMTCCMTAPVLVTMHEFNSTLAFKIHANLLIFTFLVASMQGDFQKYNCATSSILRWQHNISTCVPIYPWFVVNKHYVTSNWFEYSRWWFNGFRVLFHRFNLAFAGDWSFWALDV